LICISLYIIFKAYTFFVYVEILAFLPGGLLISIPVVLFLPRTPLSAPGHTGREHSGREPGTHVDTGLQHGPRTRQRVTGGRAPGAAPSGSSGATLDRLGLESAAASWLLSRRRPLLISVVFVSAAAVSITRVVSVPGVLVSSAISVSCVFVSSVIPVSVSSIVSVSRIISVCRIISVSSIVFVSRIISASSIVSVSSIVLFVGSSICPHIVADS